MLSSFKYDETSNVHLLSNFNKNLHFDKFCENAICIDVVDTYEFNKK